jgi:uncharacterized protein
LFDNNQFHSNASLCSYNHRSCSVYLEIQAAVLGGAMFRLKYKLLRFNVLWLAILLAIGIAYLMGSSVNAVASETLKIETIWKGEDHTVRAKLYLPDGDGPFPAVILIHGSAGPDKRYDFHRPALLDEGIAVLQVNYKKGIFKGPKDRPPVANFSPFVFSTLDAIREHKSIDPKRIGVMGFSFGGYLTTLASWQDTQEMEMDADMGFLAHVAFYPNCHHLNRQWFSAFDKTITAPLLILTGEKDSYGDGEYCPTFVETLRKTNSPDQINLKIYPGTYHGFDGKTSWSGTDPAATYNNKKAVLKPNPKAAKDAQTLAITLFKTTFGL